jgi:hypothetical protein
MPNSAPGPSIVQGEYDSTGIDIAARLSELRRLVPLST